MTKKVTKPAVKAAVVKAEKGVKVEKAEKPPKVAATKLELSIIEAIKTAKLGLPDWAAFAKQEHLTLEYVQNRVDWMRRMNMIR